MRRTAHNIGKVGHAVMAGEHLEPANNSDLSEADLAAIDAHFPRPGTEAFYEAADRAVAAKKDWRCDPLSAEFLRIQAMEHRDAEVRGSL